MFSASVIFRNPVCSFQLFQRAQYVYRQDNAGRINSWL